MTTTLENYVYELSKDIWSKINRILNFKIYVTKSWRSNYGKHSKSKSHSIEIVGESKCKICGINVNNYNYPIYQKYKKHLVETSEKIKCQIWVVRVRADQAVGWRP